MSNDNLLLKKEMTQSMKGYINSMRDMMDCYIKNWEIAKQALSCIKNHHQFLKIFSSEEIIAINQSDRKISEEIENLLKLKDLICFENFQFIRDGSLKKEIIQIKARFEDMRIFIEDKNSKIPKIKITLFDWLVLPYSTLKYLLGGCIYKIRMFKSKRK